MEFSMRVSPMWPNVVPHLCGILLVLRHLASVLWMYYITINIHNIRPIDDGSMALMLFITPNMKSSLMNNLLARYLMQRARVWKSKMNYESKYMGNTPMEGIVTFTMFPVYTLTSFLASLSGHSSSYIELQQNAIERAILWWTHNTQELVINMFNHNSQELYLWPAFYTSKTCMTFIHELDIPVFFPFAFILLAV